MSNVRIDRMVGEHQARPYASHHCINAATRRGVVALAQLNRAVELAPLHQRRNA
jgi:sulfur relay (sulfurtransferase) complex TusBCD TusD component (DsrE family)